MDATRVSPIAPQAPKRSKLLRLGRWWAGSRTEPGDPVSSPPFFRPAVAAILFFGLAFPTSAIGQTPTQADVLSFGLYNDCRPMGVEVRTWGDGSLPSGLTVELMQASAELMLRRHGLYTAEEPSVGSAGLVVEVGVTGDDAFRAVVIGMSFWRAFRNGRGQPGAASAYHRPAISTQPTGDSILSLLESLLTLFLADYLRVNEVTCPNEQ